METTLNQLGWNVTKRGNGSYTMVQPNGFTRTFRNQHELRRAATRALRMGNR